MWHWISENILQLVGLGTLVWSIIQFLVTRERDLQFREFEVYHKLIKDLVSPEERLGQMFIDRQAAIVFELRNFPRYFEFSDRTLRHLRQSWEAKNPEAYRRLIDEIDLSLDFIATQRPFWWRRAWSDLWGQTS